MKISRENIRLSLVLLKSWFVCLYWIRVARRTGFIKSLLDHNVKQNALNEREWKLVKKSAKGIRMLSPLMGKKMVCLMEASILKRTLDRYSVSSRFHLGTKKNEGAFVMHAWLSVEGKTIMGGPVSGYKEFFKTH